MGTPVPAYAAPPTVGEAGRAERNRAVFDRVWQLVADLHYDPKLGGVDWPAAAVNFGPQAVAAADDRALYRVLNAMLEPLGDSDITALTELLAAAGLNHKPQDFKRVASARSLYHWNADADQTY